MERKCEEARRMQSHRQTKGLEDKKRMLIGEKNFSFFLSFMKWTAWTLS